MKIYSNWGDKYFVGLNGIELFDSDGQLVHIEKVRETTPIKLCLINHKLAISLFSVPTYLLLFFIVRYFRIASRKCIFHAH